jgi:hypothetical protein
MRTRLTKEKWKEDRNEGSAERATEKRRNEMMLIIIIITTITTTINCLEVLHQFPHN